MASLKQLSSYDEYSHSKGIITNNCILQNTISSKQSSKQQYQQQQPFQSVATLLQKIPHPQSSLQPGGSSSLIPMLAMTPSTTTTPSATSPSMKVGRKISSNNAISLTIHGAERLQLALGAQSCRNNHNTTSKGGSSGSSAYNNFNFIGGSDINTVKMINTMKNKDNLQHIHHEKWINNNNAENEPTFHGGSNIREFKCNTARTTTSAATPREELKYFSSVKRQKQMLLEQQQQQQQQRSKQQSQQISENKGDNLESSSVVYHSSGAVTSNTNIIGNTIATTTAASTRAAAVTSGASNLAGSQQGEPKTTLKRERCAINKQSKIHKTSARQQSIHGSNPQQGMKQSQEQHSNISNHPTTPVVNDNRSIINDSSINPPQPLAASSKSSTKKHHKKSASQVAISTGNITKDPNNISNITAPTPKGQSNKLKQSLCAGNGNTNNVSISEQSPANPQAFQKKVQQQTGIQQQQQQQQAISPSASPGKHITSTATGGHRQGSKFKSKSIHCLISSVINEEDQRMQGTHNGSQQPRFYLKQPISPCSISSPIASPASVPKVKSPQSSSNTSSAQIISYQHRSASSFYKQTSATKTKKKSSHKQQVSAEEQQHLSQQQQQQQQQVSRTAEILSQISRNAVRIRRELSAKRKDDQDAEMKKKEERTLLKEKNNNIRQNNLIKFSAQQQQQQQQQQQSQQIKNNQSPSHQRIIPWGIDQQKLQRFLFKDCLSKESQKHIMKDISKREQETTDSQVLQLEQSQKKTIDSRQRRIDLGLSCLNNLEESAIQTILQAQKKKEDMMIKANGQKQEQISQQQLQQQQQQPQLQQRRSSPEERQLIQQFMQTKKRMLDEQEQLIKKNDVSKQAKLKLNLEMLKHEIKEQQVSSTHSQHHHAHKSSAKKQLKRQMKNYANEYQNNNNNLPRCSPRQALLQSPSNQLMSSAFPYSQANSLSQEQENQVSEYIYEEFKRQFDWRGESQQQQGLGEQQGSSRGVVGGQLEEQYYQLGEGEVQASRQQQQLSVSNRKRAHKHTKRSPSKENTNNKSNNQYNVEGHDNNQVIKDNGELNGYNHHNHSHKPSFEERKLQVLMQFNSLSERLSKQILQQNYSAATAQVVGASGGMEAVQVGKQGQDQNQQQNDHLFKNQLLQQNMHQQGQQYHFDSKNKKENGNERNQQTHEGSNSSNSNINNNHADVEEILMDRQRINTSELKKEQNTSKSNSCNEKKIIMNQNQKISQQKEEGEEEGIEQEKKQNIQYKQKQYAVSEPAELVENRRLTYGQDSEESRKDKAEETSQNRSNNVNAFDLYHQTYQTEEGEGDDQRFKDHEDDNNDRKGQWDSNKNKQKKSTAALLAEQTEKYLRSPKEASGIGNTDSESKKKKKGREGQGEGDNDIRGNRGQESQEQLIGQITTIESGGSQTEGQQYQEQQSQDHEGIEDQSMQDSNCTNHQYEQEEYLSKSDCLILHMAAIFIQKVWRGYWTRKLIEMYFYQQYNQINGQEYMDDNYREEEEEQEEKELHSNHGLAARNNSNNQHDKDNAAANAAVGEHDDDNNDIHAEVVTGSAVVAVKQPDRLQEEQILQQESEKKDSQKQEEIMDKEKEQSAKKDNKQEGEAAGEFIDSLSNQQIKSQENVDHESNNNNVDAQSMQIMYKQKYESMRQEQLQKWGELISKLKDAAGMDSAVNHDLILQICQASENNQLSLMQKSFNAAISKQDANMQEKDEEQLKEQKNEEKGEQEGYQKSKQIDTQDGAIEDDITNNKELIPEQNGRVNETASSNNQLNKKELTQHSVQDKDQGLISPSHHEQKSSRSQSVNDVIIPAGQLERLQEGEMSSSTKLKDQLVQDQQKEMQQQYLSMRQEGLVLKRGECIPDIQRNRRNIIPSGFIQTAPTPVNNNNTDNQGVTLGTSPSYQQQQGESALPFNRQGFTEELLNQKQQAVSSSQQQQQQPANHHHHQHHQDDHRSLKSDDSQQDQFQEYQRLLLSQSQQQQQQQLLQQQQSSSSSSISFSEFPADAYSSMMLKKESMESLMKMGKDVLKHQRKAKISIIHKLFEQHKVDPQTYDAKKKDIEQWEVKEQLKLKKAHHEIERGWRKFAETVQQTKRGIEFMRQVQSFEQGNNSKLSASGFLKESQAQRSFWSSRVESEGSEQLSQQHGQQQQYQDINGQYPAGNGRLSSNHSIRVINQYRLTDGVLGTHRLKSHSSKTCQSDDEKVLLHTNESEESNFPEDINDYLRKMKEIAARSQQQNQMQDQSEDILIKEFFGMKEGKEQDEDHHYKDIRNDSSEDQQYLEEHKQQDYEHGRKDNNDQVLAETNKQVSGDGGCELSAGKPVFVGSSNSLGQLGTPKVLVFDGSHLLLPYEVSPIPNISSPQQEEEKAKSNNSNFNGKAKEKELFVGDQDGIVSIGKERVDEEKVNVQNKASVGVENTPIRNGNAIMVQPSYSPFQKLESIQSSSESVGEGFLEGEPLLLNGNIQHQGGGVQIEKKPMTTAEAAGLCQSEESATTHDEIVIDKKLSQQKDNNNNDNLNDMNINSSPTGEVQLDQQPETLPSEQQLRIPTSDEEDTHNNINNNSSIKYLPIESCQNLNSIKDFLIALAEFIKENFREEFIERVNQPLGIDPLEFLKTFNITDTTEQQQDTEASNSPMYPIVKYIHVQKPVVSEEIFLTFNELYQRMVRRQKKLELAGEDSKNPQDFDAFDDDENIDIFNSQSDIEKYNLKLVFDCLNESLDYFRVYGLGGSPLPWKLNQKKLSSAVVLDEDIERVLGLAIGRMLKWGSSLCGFISEKIEFPVGQEEENRVYLNQIKEDRLAQMLENEVLEGESKWLVYEEEETDVELEIADDIFHYLVSEAAQWMQYKMEGRLDQLVEKENNGKFEGDNKNYYYQRNFEDMLKDEGEEDEDEEVEDDEDGGHVREILDYRKDLGNNGGSIQKDLIQKTNQEYNNMNPPANSTEGNNQDSIEERIIDDEDDNENDNISRSQEQALQQQQQQPLQHLWTEKRRRAQMEERMSKQNERFIPLQSLEQSPMQKQQQQQQQQQAIPSKAALQWFASNKPSSSQNTNNLSF